VDFQAVCLYTVPRIPAINQVFSINYAASYSLNDWDLMTKVIIQTVLAQDQSSRHWAGAVAGNQNNFPPANFSMIMAFEKQK